MDKRLERLESLYELQERSLENLNDQIFDQQKQIDDLTRLVERLAGKIRVLGEALDDSGGVDVPPPHYNG